jgi:prepilin-type N-terminal cleavage/methylation domain-containing protein
VTFRDQKSTSGCGVRHVRTGFTLIEMLVATAATLILMGAVAQMFAIFGDAVRGSRATLGLDGRLRNVAWRLRTDLAGTTARMSPPLSPDSGEGYFEIIEGPLSDYQEAANPPVPLSNGMTTIGPTDIDDALLFTTRNTETPFIGRAPTNTANNALKTDTFESTVAEVAWFARVTPGTTNPVTYTLYRKQLLVIGYVGSDPFTADNKISFDTYGSTWAHYYNAPCDISVRREASPSGSTVVFDTLIPNSLADLTRRESRFLHNPAGLTTDGFPFPFVAHQTASTSGNSEVLPAELSGLIFDSTSQRHGEDVVLDNVIAFDVRVFDPAAPVYVTTPGGTPLVPGDPGFTNTAVASGAYVDLGHGATTNSLLTGVVPHYAGYGDTRSELAGSATARRTYDTWSTNYEADGRDSDGDGPFDEGADGLDNDNPPDGVVDEPDVDSDGDGIITLAERGESETAPPYPHALRGIEVRIRCYEPSSRQVRQVTVRHTFVPH